MFRATAYGGVRGGKGSLSMEGYFSMSRKYYTHFMTEAPEMPAAPDEYRGVVELRAALRPHREAADLRALLASNLDMAAEDIHILNWARLH